MGLIKALILIAIIYSVFAVGNVLAVPDIQIVSPQNITYASTRILVNVTSSEPTDFFNLVGVRPKKNQILANNTTSFTTYLYAKNGDYNYTIYAGNSTSNVSKSVAFRIVNVSNPINLTECGYIYSSDTHYFVGQDIGLGGMCINLISTRNISLDLNHYSTGQINIVDGSEVSIFNGSIYGNNYLDDIYAAVYLSSAGTTGHLRDLYIQGSLGMFIGIQGGLLVENVTINASVGIWLYDLHHAEFRNVSIFHRKDISGWGDMDSGIYDVSSYSEIVFNNLTIDNDFPNSIYFENYKNTYYLRSSQVNLENISVNAGATPYDNRIFIQHKVLMNVTDELGNPLPSTIEVRDNSTYFTYSDDDLKYKYLLNPLLPRFVGTDSDGKAEIWLNEKLKYYKSGSPITLTEYDFYPYNLTAMSHNHLNSQIVNLTGRNSTFTANFTINFQTLPSCTLQQMFDLNGDDVVNIQDAALILRHITGQPVSVNITKQCEGRSFFASS